LRRYVTQICRSLSWTDRAREVKLLSDHCRDLVVQRTRIAARVRWHLHELDPRPGGSSLRFGAAMRR
jgi:hypothetical protein